MRRTVLALLAVLVVAATLGIAAVATGGGSTVTRARLERSLPETFANLYVKKAHLLGRTDVTVESLNAKAMCDKHGPDVADVGPGGDWVCLMSWDDPEFPLPAEGYGKFELNVHSNDCYTAVGSAKVVGYLEMTDAQGRAVINPLSEFDGCFDPRADDSATGVSFPSLLSITSTTVTPAADGSVPLDLTCGTGRSGCAGRVEASLDDGTSLGTQAFDLQEEATTVLEFPGPLPAGTTEVTFAVHGTRGIVPGSPTTIAVQGLG